MAASLVLVTCAAAVGVGAAQVSQAAKPLCWWVLSAAELLRVGREADLKRMKIGEAEERLEAATK